jgi:hypothetical protein
MQRITPKGFIDHKGKEHEVDIIICATGWVSIDFLLSLYTSADMPSRFDTTWVPRFPIVANGKNIQDMWRKRPLSYLAIAVPESKHLAGTLHVLARPGI